MRSLIRVGLMGLLALGTLLSAPAAPAAEAATCLPPAGNTTVRGYLSVYEGVGYTGACAVFPVRYGYYNLPSGPIHDNAIKSVRIYRGTSGQWFYGRLFACTGLNMTGTCRGVIVSTPDLRSLSTDPTISFFNTISSFRVESLRNWNPYGTCWCTWGAAYQMEKYLSPTRSPRAVPGFRGDGRDWDTSARANGWPVRTTPMAHAVASWEPGYYPRKKTWTGSVYLYSPIPTPGHVSWVDALRRDTSGRLWVHVWETSSCGAVTDAWYMPTGHVARSSTSTVLHAMFIYMDAG